MHPGIPLPRKANPNMNTDGESDGEGEHTEAAWASIAGNEKI